MIKILNKDFTISDIQLLLSKETKDSYDKALIDDWNRRLSIYLSNFKAYSDICIPCQQRHNMTIDELYKHIDIDKVMKNKGLTIEEIDFIFECLGKRYN